MLSRFLQALSFRFCLIMPSCSLPQEIYLETKTQKKISHSPCENWVSSITGWDVVYLNLNPACT